MSFDVVHRENLQAPLISHGAHLNLRVLIRVGILSLVTWLHRPPACFYISQLFCLQPRDPSGLPEVASSVVVAAWARL